jgi:hypothetical protein
MLEHRKTTKLEVGGRPLGSRFAGRVQLELEDWLRDDEHDLERRLV